MDVFPGHKSIERFRLLGKRSVSCHMCRDVTGVYLLFKMAHGSESSDSVDCGSELSEFEDVELLNSAAVEIVPWRFEPRGRPRERLHFEREDEERVDRDDRGRNTDW